MAEKHRKKKIRMKYFLSFFVKMYDLFITKPMLDLSQQMRNDLLQFKLFYKYHFLALLGFFINIAFIYYTYLRPRLPRVIPFQLDELRFYALFFMCLFYVYVIYRFIYPKTPSKIVLSILIFIGKPIVFFDHYIKNHRMVKSYYRKYLENSLDSLAFLGPGEIAIIIYVFELIPRVILLVILIYDIFVAKNITLFYYFIFLGLIPLFYQYIIISLKREQIEYYNFLESLYDNVTIYDEAYKEQEIYGDERDNENLEPNPKAIHNDTYVSLRKYFEIQLENWHDFKLDQREIIYKGYPYSKGERYTEYKKKKYGLGTMCDLVQEDFNFLREEFNEIDPHLRNLNLFFDHHESVIKKYYVLRVKFALLLAYCFIWSYVLMASIHTLTSLSMTLKILAVLTKYSFMYEPFSETLLFSYEI